MRFLFLSFYYRFLSWTSFIESRPLSSCHHEIRFEEVNCWSSVLNEEEIIIWDTTQNKIEIYGFICGKFMSDFNLICLFLVGLASLLVTTAPNNSTRYRYFLYKPNHLIIINFFSINTT